MSEVELTQIPVGSALILKSEKKARPFYVDFLSPRWQSRWKQGLSKNHIFRRALGFQKVPWKVLDLTAGFGADCMMALSLGCEVTAVERNPTVFKLLNEGVERAREEATWRDRLKSLKLVQADAIDYLQALQAKDFPNVIYLDPMFEKPKKTAKSPKEMQLLQGLVGESKLEEEQRLLDLALQRALNRVVVKRPLKARALQGLLKHSFKGQSVRYDVY